MTPLRDLHRNVIPARRCRRQTRLIPETAQPLMMLDASASCPRHQAHGCRLDGAFLKGPVYTKVLDRALREIAQHDRKFVRIVCSVAADA
ncbi:hypothetical protein IA54_015380 [Xanthomonas phaseoli pv. syngonii LMG 9055]|uniref:Uncharacterized protein n=1 Tax=Xanthomonas phaseoli pv. syngonii LMG 9055 TaxID=1437878 RepID=A0A1V9GKY9_9XANT|nr:hypothetical protein IA54_015380 [Xanthomonas phaseoli pv. syngonii LMG 9055]